MTTIRVAIVDDQQLLVSAFSALIGAQADMEVAITASNGRQALERLSAELQRARGAAPLVVLMDLRMPVMDGIGAIAALRAHQASAGLPILVLTTFDDEELVLASLRAGANGFLLKDASPEVLLEAIRVVAQGGAWLDPAVTGTVLAHLEGHPDAGPPTTGGTAVPGPASSSDPSPAPGGLYEPLTPREEAVLALVCQGQPNAGIAQRLHLAESTIKTHVKAILGKTGCANRVELVIHAFAVGLVPLPRVHRESR